MRLQTQTLHSVLLLLLLTCCVFAGSSRVVESSSSSAYLRGPYHLQLVDQKEQLQIIDTQQHEEEQQSSHGRRIKADNNNNNEQSTLLLLLSQPPTFQIILSTILSILTILQAILFTTFLINRSKRVLEFAQPIVICLFLSCSIITTSTCFFYIYYNHNVICAIREPLMFGSVSFMGATVGGRAWRISTLLNNPLLSVGRSGGSGSGEKDGIPRIEKARQFTLRLLSVLSGCEYSLMGVLSSSSSSRRGGGSGGSGSGGRPIRVQITFWQMIRATIIMIVPQLIWQVIVLSVPMLRPSRTLVSHSYYSNNSYYTIQNDEQDYYQEDGGVITMNQYQCQASVGFWPNYIGIILTLFPFAIAYLLNVRPKSELDQLPEIVDERIHLISAFGIFVRILIVAVPMIGLTYNNNPAAKAYGAICAVLGLPLACCYHIAYVKLNTTKSNISKQQQRRMSGGLTTGTSALMNGGDGTDGRSSAALAVRMAEMYSRIGRTEETVELVDETLSVFRKGNSGNLQNLVVQSDGRQEIASGFTANDLKALEADELQMIIQLLRLKGNALIKLKGPAGFPLS